MARSFPTTGETLSKTQSLEPEGHSAPIVGYHLLVIEGTSSTRRLLPHDGALLVGRVPEAELRFDVASVSRRHARFVVSNGEVAVVDLGSHNGTRVGGERIEGTRRLWPGDVVTIGEVTFIVLGERSSAKRQLLDVYGLRKRIDDEVERSLDHGRPLSLLVLSVGKGIDRDAVSTHAIKLLARSDAVGWVSEQQMVIVLPERSEKEAEVTCQMLLDRIASIATESKIGLAVCPADGCDQDTLMAGARSACEVALPHKIGWASQAVTEYTVGEHVVTIADPAMLRLFELIRRLAPTDLPVLVFGETGTGKENISLAMHHWSKRSNEPLVTINGSAIPENLAESELFGYEPGAFSDARTAKPGLLEKANGGTLFLDEVGELSEKVQAKLLRVLETKRTMRLGGLKEREVNVRIVAATNRDLEAECQAKRFRKDLYFRLNAAAVHLPPLRQRPREIPILARRFLADACSRLGIAVASLSEAVLQGLMAYPFPGNVRELKNAMEYAAATMGGTRVELWDLPDGIRRWIAAEDLGSIKPPPDDEPSGEDVRIGEGEVRRRASKPTATSLAEELRSIEQTRIKEALEATGGVQVRAAELLGMPIRTLVHKLKQYNLRSKVGGKNL